MPEPQSHLRPGIGGAASAAFRQAPIGGRRAWAALALVAAVVAAGPLAYAAGSSLMDGAWLAAATIAGVMAQGALYRAALARPGIGPGGLQWRGPEWRLLAAGLLTAAFLAVLVLLALTAVICAAYAVASTGSGFNYAVPDAWSGAVDWRGHLVVDAVALAAAAGIVWAMARISLAAATSVAGGRVRVLSTWAMTRRSALPVLLGWTASIAVFLTLTCLLAPLSRSATAPVAFVADLALGVGVGGLWLPMSVGLMAYLYRCVAPS